VLSNGATACAIRTPHYALTVDVASSSLFALQGADGTCLVQGIAAASLSIGERQFAWTGQPAPHLHTLRAGPHLVELCIEDIILTAGGETWPGLAELHLTCQERKLYLHARFLLPSGEWINAGRFVYSRPQGHPTPVACSPSQAGVILSAPRETISAGNGLLVGIHPCVGITATLPQGGAVPLSAADGKLALSVPVGETPWTTGSAAEAAWAFVVAPNRTQAAAALDMERHPLAPEAFETTMGKRERFDPRTGLYVFRAQTSPTPEPPRGFRAGTSFAVSNDDRERDLLVDSFDPWGGVCGGVVRDEHGIPLPIRIQYALNFPELAAEAGEPGWAALTFPLSLAPHERRSLTVEHLYGGARDHDLLFLTSLENVGGPLLMQATVSRLESFTVTTGGELRINDFRRHYRDLRVRSVSAILPTFFAYYDADDRYQGLIPQEVRIREAGPLLAEVTIAARTADGRVAGDIRLWEVPCSDVTRLFAEVALVVKQDLRLSSLRPAPLFLLRHHAFNPMAYRRFAAWVEPGRVYDGELDFTPHIGANGMPLAEHPFGCLYQASNPIDQGIPCSDIVGNPGWVLLDIGTRLGDAPLPVGLYAFGTGANDTENGDYARDLAVVPAPRLGLIPAGTVIKYRAVQVIYGDNGSDYAPLLAERKAWCEKPLRLEARVGSVASEFPPQLRCDNDVAEFTLTGGTDWMAVRVGGFRHSGGLAVFQIGADGAAAPLSHVRYGEPWYIAWPDGEERIGYTFLVKLPSDGSRLRLRVGLANQQP